MNEAQSNSMDDEVLWYNGGTIPLEHQLAPPAIIPPFHYSNHRLLWYIDVLNSLLSLSGLHQLNPFNKTSPMYQGVYCFL